MTSTYIQNKRGWTKGGQKLFFIEKQPITIKTIPKNYTKITHYPTTTQAKKSTPAINNEKTSISYSLF